jgi:hypothetical protein
MPQTNLEMDAAAWDLVRRLTPPDVRQPETTWPGAAFVYGVVAMLAPERAVEVGCCIGTTSAWIYRALDERSRGHLDCYEIDAISRDRTEDLLQSLYPGGRWSIYGDFFSDYDGGPVDFAFIDPEPKDLYLSAFERIKWASSAAFLAHDSTPPGSWQDVVNLVPVAKAAGFRCFNVTRERGFILGLRG